MKVMFRSLTCIVLSPLNGITRFYCKFNHFKDLQILRMKFGYSHLFKDYQGHYLKIMIGVLGWMRENVRFRRKNGIFMVKNGVLNSKIGFKIKNVFINAKV